MAGLHGVGDEASGGDDGVVDGFVAKDAGHGGDGLGELACLTMSVMVRPSPGCTDGDCGLPVRRCGLPSL